MCEPDVSELATGWVSFVNGLTIHQWGTVLAFFDAPNVGFPLAVRGVTGNNQFVAGAFVCELARRDGTQVPIRPKYLALLPPDHDVHCIHQVRWIGTLVGTEPIANKYISSSGRCRWRWR